MSVTSRGVGNVNSSLPSSVKVALTPSAYDFGVVLSCATSSELSVYRQSVAFGVVGVVGADVTMLVTTAPRVVVCCTPFVVAVGCDPRVCAEVPAVVP